MVHKPDICLVSDTVTKKFLTIFQVAPVTVTAVEIVNHLGMHPIVIDRGSSRSAAAATAGFARNPAWCLNDQIKIMRQNRLNQRRRRQNCSYNPE